MRFRGGGELLGACEVWVVPPGLASLYSAFPSAEALGYAGLPLRGRTLQRFRGWTLRRFDLTVFFVFQRYCILLCFDINLTGFCCVSTVMFSCKLAAMRLSRSWRTLLIVLALSVYASASAYNARPKLVVVIVIDQFRGDYLERYRDQFSEGGFRVFLDRGAYFTDCNYDYANTRTAPGHATLFTGTYTSGHGIVANEWWDPAKKKRVTAVEDDNTKLVGTGADRAAPGASPHNLLSDTLGDELKLATGGKARVFAISLKDRAAVLPAGFAGDAAYWIDPKSGDWITSTYYRPDLPEWVRNFNGTHPGEGRAAKYWNREWKDREGNVLGSTARRNGKDGSPAGFYEVVGS